jgi:hypothetical protein
MATATPGWLIRRLKQIPNSHIEPLAAPGHLAIRIGNRERVVFEVTSRLSQSGAEVLKYAREFKRHQPGKPRPLLALDNLSRTIQHEMTHAGVSWVERRTGVVHVEADGLYVHDTGLIAEVHDDRNQEHDVGLKRPTRLRGMSGRCAEALLLQSASHLDDVTITPSELASLAAVSVPLANAVLRRLESAGAVTADRVVQRARAYHLTHPALVLDIWSEEEDFASTNTTLAYVWAPSFQQFLHELSRLSENVPAWALGGETAANLYAPTLTTDPTVMIWIPDAMPAEDIATALGGKVVTDGANMTIRQLARDPWARFRHPTNPLLSSNNHLHEIPGLARDNATIIPGAERLPPLWLVSKPRAIVEAAREGRGRSEEVADAARQSLALRS